VPTPERLHALSRYTGRGVTIAFLDSGFCVHPDLVEPEDRILAYVDVTRARSRRNALLQPDESSAHGLMAAAVACGNGRLSGRRYRGLAPQASLVLVKCGTARRIRHSDLERGLLWVVRNRRRYGIRIASVSCGGDFEASYLTDGLSRAAERATRSGIFICAAAGNGGRVLPPASAPSVLAVGGIDYPTSHGPTLDGFRKPELLAPARGVAAPFPPGHASADAYHATEGTSVAAPIVASIAAQMLEANPALTPGELREILLGTARRLAGVPLDRQGWGAVDARRAVLAAAKEQDPLWRKSPRCGTPATRGLRWRRSQVACGTSVTHRMLRRDTWREYCCLVTAESHAHCIPDGISNPTHVPLIHPSPLRGDHPPSRAPRAPLGALDFFRRYNALLLLE
jgi:serine protease AprX